MKHGLQFVNRFARENWFKLFLLLLALYVFFQKDLSFQIQFRSPEGPGREEAPAQVQERGKREKMTNKMDSGKTASSGMQRDLLDMGTSLLRSSRESALRETLRGVEEETKLAYLKRFARVAVAEHKKFGAPASITLASALLHSSSGKAAWAEGGANQFALACLEGWPGESGVYEGRCLRHYESAWASFRDHSLYLSKEIRNSLPFGQNADYRQWAKALSKAPYSREEDIAAALIEIVETYSLFELDELP
jgi:flagellum-specific peptidoglycan hydrolase FlgJ